VSVEAALASSALETLMAFWTTGPLAGASSTQQGGFAVEWQGGWAERLAGMAWPQWDAAWHAGAERTVMALTTQ